MTLQEFAKLKFDPVDNSDLEALAGLQNPETAMIAFDDNNTYVIDGDSLFIIDDRGEQTEFSLTQVHVFH